MLCKNCGNYVDEKTMVCNFCKVSYDVKDTSVTGGGLIINNEFFPFRRKNGTNAAAANRIIIGRKDIVSDPQIDIGPFDKDLHVSRKHGVVEFEDGQVFYTDLSKNGTLINDTRCTKGIRYSLNDGDRLFFGDVCGVVKLD